MDRNYADLWLYVRRLSAGSSDTEDLVQQAFLLAFERLAAGSDFTGDVGKWLRGAARNLVCAWWRKNRKTSQNLADRMNLLAEESEHALSQAVRTELESALDRCIEKLQAADREILADRYRRDLAVSRIAEKVHESETTVRVRLFRVRQALRKCMEAALPSGREE